MNSLQNLREIRAMIEHIHRVTIQPEARDSVRNAAARVVTAYRSRASLTELSEAIEELDVALRSHEPITIG